MLLVVRPVAALPHALGLCLTETVQPAESIEPLDLLQTTDQAALAAELADLYLVLTDYSMEGLT